jgi:hypothetical protein
MLKLDRKTLAQFLPNSQSILVFEKMILDVGETLPTTIEEANALAAQSQFMAAAALATLAALVAEVEPLAAAPVISAQADPDDAAPRAHAGTMSTQNHDAVDITGGTAGLDAGAAATPSLWFGGDRTSGFYRSAANVVAVSISGTQRAYFDATGLGVWGTVSASGQLVSTIASGTAPLVVSSTTRVANLNVERAGLADLATNATNAAHATTADNLGTAGSYPADASDLATAITLVNYIKSRNISKGV